MIAHWIETPNGTKVARCMVQGKEMKYEVTGPSAGFYISAAIFPDSSRFILNASEMSQAGAMARCEMNSAQ